LLLSISRELAATLDLSTVLERVLILSTANVGAERGSLLAMDANGRPLEAALTVDSKLLHPTVQEMQAILDHGLAGWVAKQRQPVMIANTSQDERWTRRPDDSTERSGSKSAICMPLIAQEQLVGVLTLVHARPNFFSESHFTLLQAIADLASIAIRNAQLNGSVEAAQRRYYVLFDDSIDPVLISSPDGHILECNRQAQQTSAYDRAELIGLSVHDLHAPAEEKVGVRFEHSKTAPQFNMKARCCAPMAQPSPSRFRCGAYRPAATRPCSGSSATSANASSSTACATTWRHGLPRPAFAAGQYHLQPGFTRRAAARGKQ
jgi:PAS domain-containing protein